MSVPGGIVEPAWPDDAIEVGRILGAYGIQGWIKVQPYASDPQALFSSRRWFLKPPDIPIPKRDGGSFAVPPLLKIATAKEHGDTVVAQVKDVADRNAAEGLRGARIFVPRSSFPSVDEDEFYWVDLIGLAVANLEGVELGTVVSLIDTGPHSVLCVSPPGVEASDASTQRLIPFVAAYVSQVSLAERRITVDWGADY